MQIVSKSCGICQHRISFHNEGTWCASCNTVFHNSCIQEADDICPTCNCKRDLPEKYFVYSKKCPECFSDNIPPSANCNGCGAKTLFENRNEYAELVKGIHTSATRTQILGSVELFFGMVLFVSFWFAVWWMMESGFIILLGVWIGAPMILIPRGFFAFREATHKAKLMRQFQ